ncbi:MAG: NADH-quinone oxidoreductase subunit NuoE [Saprospiraceae bacterium]|nr:NADH-quinone oxidoreductase subunit NuoE [Saprospiraceae bacterium]MBK8668153.1 NADH-quinone oxidoreductase subunit NuoE [Saprospiraceae bacterium]MBL0099373.1 NADH-quinone oxidoreductase subunit NuoE [Saprospiraceae bacterium]
MTQTEQITFSQKSMEEMDRIILQYPPDKKKSALLPVLHIVQQENGNWLSTEVMDKIAKILDIKPIEVYEVASFYSMYNLEPVGKIVIEVCHTGPCMICGAEKIIAHIENKLNIKVGETTEDKMFTLKTVECLGACGYAPMFQIGEQYYENLTIEQVDNILDSLRKEKEAIN